MHVLQFFLSHRSNVSALGHKAPYPPVSVLHQPLFPRVVGMGKIDTRAKKSLQLSPARESDVVVGGDTSNNNIFQDQRKRSTNSAALSVWQLFHPAALGEPVHNHQEYRARVFGHNEVHLQMAHTVHRGSIVDVDPPVMRQAAAILLPASLALVPAPEEVLFQTPALGELVDGFC